MEVEIDGCNNGYSISETSIENREGGVGIEEVERMGCMEMVSEDMAVVMIDGLI